MFKTGLLLLAEDHCDSGHEYVIFQHKMLQEYSASYFLHKEYLSKRIDLVALFPRLRSIIDHSVVLQFLCGQSEVMSQIVMNTCCSVIANSFAANLDGVQCLFSVHWLIDERSYLSGINKIVPKEKIMSWPDAVGTYLQTTFETIRAMHRECKQPSHTVSFCSKDLWVLSSGAWSIPMEPPNKQKLVIVHSLDTKTASTYLSVRHEKLVTAGCVQGILIAEPKEDYKHVMPCLTKIASDMGNIRTIFLCDILLDNATDEQLEVTSDLSNVLFNRKDLEHVIVLKSKLPETFYANMFMGVAQNVHLEKLDLYFCQIPHAGVSILSKALSKLTKLTSLKLRHCIRNSSDAELICKQLCHLVSLKHLDLSKNPYIGHYAGILTETFSTWESHPLENLWVRECHIPVKQGKLFLRSLTNLPKLQVASLPCNGLDGAISEFVSKAPSLKELYLWKCGLQTEDVLGIAAAIQAHRLPNLRRLHMEGNDLTDNQVEPLLAQLDINHSAEILLDVSNNNLSKEFVEHWSSKIRNGLNICWNLDKKYMHITGNK